MALTARQVRERKRLWDKWEARLNYATNAMQGALIVLFACLSVFALLGKFVNAPEYVVISSWALLLLLLLGSARPVAKRFFVQGRAATAPTHTEFWATLALSTTAIGTCAVLWWQGVLYQIERGIMVWTYWAFSLLLMQLTGLFVGYLTLVLLFTGFFFCCCCNCCCRGPWLAPLFGWCRRRARRQRERALSVTAVTAAVSASAQQLTKSPKDLARSAKSSLHVIKASRDRYREAEVEVKGMDEVEPILDFVENKAQISFLMPLIFIYSIAISSAFVLGGSILVGPSTMLPKTAGPPVMITALCKSPVQALLTAQADRFLPKLPAASAVASHYLWELVAAPPLDLCADVQMSDNNILRADWEQGLSPEQASYVPPRTRAKRWAFAAALPANAGASAASATTAVELPPIVFAVHDGQHVGVANAKVSASIYAFYPDDGGGLSAAASPPAIANGTGINTTDTSGIAQLTLRVEGAAAEAGASETLLPGELILRVASAGLERFASVRLYAPPTPPMTVAADVAVTSAASLDLDNVTTVAAVSRVLVDHSLAATSVTTFVNRTTYMYASSERTSLLSATSDVSSVTHRDRSYHMLLVLEPPPAEAQLRTPFNVTLMVATQRGMPVPGVEVSVALLTLKSTNTRIDGNLRGFTDASGVVTLTLEYTHGITHTHCLAFLTDTIISQLHEQLYDDAAWGAQHTARLGQSAAKECSAGKAECGKLVRDTLAGRLPPASIEPYPLAASLGNGGAGVTGGNEYKYESGAHSLASDLSQAADGGTVGGPGSALSGMDAIFTHVEPLVMKGLLGGMSSIVLADRLIRGSTLPTSPEKLREAAIATAKTVWGLLPVPRPYLVRLRNPLDADSTSGATLTAPLYGYALAESSPETSATSGMSTCTLEGYARYEPSPRAFDASVPFLMGVLQWPLRMVPRSWASTLARYAAKLDNDEDGRPRYDMDATESYMASALFQPWPFRNFNFLIDDLTRSDASYHLDNCKKTYATLISAFPYRVDPKMDPKCRQQCAMHVPDYSASGFLGTGQQTSAPCPRELVKSLGVDAMPGRDLQAYGGVGTVALHLECLGCYENARYKSCEVQRSLNRAGSLGRSQLANASAKAFAFELTAALCAKWRQAPAKGIGDVYEEMLRTSSPELLANRAAAVRWLKNLTHASGGGTAAVWNPCRSRRWQRPQATDDSRTIREFSPDPKIQMRVSGNDATTSAAFGGRWPELEIRDKNSQGVFEWAPLRMRALLANVQEEWMVIQAKVLSGGSRRDLELELLVDGVPVVPSNHSWWKFDNVIEYVNPNTVNFDKFGIVLLAGHDSFRVFALITLPVFYLNMHGRHRKMPGLVASGVGMMGLLLLLWYQGSILRNSLRPLDQTPHKFTFDNAWELHRLRPMVAFGRNDLVAVFNFETASPIQIIAQLGSLLLVSLPLYLGFLSLLLRWLFVGFLQPNFPKQSARLVRLVTQAAPSVLREQLVAEEETHTSTRDGASTIPAGACGNSTQADVMNGQLPGPRALVSLGSPEPGYWFESDYHKRKRCARNHVRILLRGKIWYEAQILQVAKIKLPLPKRLLGAFKSALGSMACALSLWICFMLTLIFYNLLDWAISVLCMAGKLEATMLAMRPHSDQLSHATHLANYPVLMLSLLASFGITVTPDNPTYQTMIYAFAAIGSCGIFGCILYQWLAIFRSFKQHTFRLRKGDYFFDRDAFREEVANKYIGFQVSHMTISFFLLTAIYLAIVLTLSPFILSGLQALDEVPKGKLLSSAAWAVLGAIAPRSIYSLGALIPICGSLGFQRFCNRKIFFVGPARNQWLRYAFLYGIFDYNLIYTNALLGVAVALSRFVILFLFFVLFLARLDKTTLPGPTGGFNKYDPGFKCYIAVVRMDHRYNNAVFLTFGDIVLERLREDAMMREALKEMGEAGGKEAIINFGLRRIHSEQTALNALMMMPHASPLPSHRTTTQATSAAREPTHTVLSAGDGGSSKKRALLLTAIADRDAPRLESLMTGLTKGERAEMSAEVQAASAVVELLASFAGRSRVAMEDNVDGEHGGGEARV